VGAARKKRELRGTNADLEFISLENMRDELASALLMSEQRLLEVAIALCRAPKLLLLDEPVSGMNPVETRASWQARGDPRARHHVLLSSRPEMVKKMGGLRPHRPA